MASIFSKIIAGEIPCYKIAENEKCFAFLDISPLTMGHTLVVPKTEVDYIFDLDDELLTELNLFAKKIAAGMKEAMQCKRVGILVMGFDVPHTHIHLVPMNETADMLLTKQKQKFDKDEFEAIASKIRLKIEE